MEAFKTKPVPVVLKGNKLLRSKKITPEPIDPSSSFLRRQPAGSSPSAPAFPLLLRVFFTVRHGQRHLAIARMPKGSGIERCCRTEEVASVAAATGVRRINPLMWSFSFLL